MLRGHFTAGMAEREWCERRLLARIHRYTLDRLRKELLETGIEASVASSGPRMFHFVTGGVTPAALGADWLTSTLDQSGFAWVGSPLSAELERISIAWLADLFELPEGWGGVLTTGATMANFTALAAARRWWGERHGATQL